MAAVDQSQLHGKIRDRLIGNTLKRLLERAADDAGIDTVLVTSGSQPGSHGQRTGSTRHDNGRAADLQLIKNGRPLKFTDDDGGLIVPAFVTAAAARGATGIGAGVHYMGDKTFHVGFGTSPQDHQKLVWGAGGRSANAPRWLREAARKGWDHPIGLEGSEVSRHLGRYIVIAREGLSLRKGPGLMFDVASILDAGTEVSVLGFDGVVGDWARVDLQHDGLVDGYLYAGFLKPAGTEPSEDVVEPDAAQIEDQETLLAV